MSTVVSDFANFKADNRNRARVSVASDFSLTVEVIIIKLGTVLSSDCLRHADASLVYIDLDLHSRSHRSKPRK